MLTIKEETADDMLEFNICYSLTQAGVEFSESKGIRYYPKYMCKLPVYREPMRMMLEIFFPLAVLWFASFVLWFVDDTDLRVPAYASRLDAGPNQDRISQRP